VDHTYPEKCEINPIDVWSGRFNWSDNSSVTLVIFDEFGK
jgi:hypothetical protein